MQVKTWFIVLPLLCLAGAATAQSVSPAPATAAPADGSQAAGVPPTKAAKPQTRQRQGGDIRGCLDKKNDKAVIRCAEQGRTPAHKHARRHAPAAQAAPKSEPAPAIELAPKSEPAAKPAAKVDPVTKPASKAEPTAKPAPKR